MYSIPLPFSPEGGIAIFLSLSRSGGQQRRGKAPSAALPLFPFHISTTSSTFSSPWSVSHGQGKRRRKGKEEFVHASLGWRRKKVPFLWRRRRTEGARPIHGRKEEEEEGEVKGNISLSPFFPFKILAASPSSSWHRGLVQGKEKEAAEGIRTKVKVSGGKQGENIWEIPFVFSFPFLSHFYCFLCPYLPGDLPPVLPPPLFLPLNCEQPANLFSPSSYGGLTLGSSGGRLVGSGAASADISLFLLLCFRLPSLPFPSPAAFSPLLLRCKTQSIDRIVGREKGKISLVLT